YSLLPHSGPAHHQEFSPTPPLALVPAFGPAKQIALGYNAHHGPARVHDRQAAEFALQHQPDGVGDGSVRRNTRGIRGHDVSGPHGVFSSFEFRACLSVGARPLYDGKNFERRGPYAQASNQSVRSSSFGTCGGCFFLSSCSQPKLYGLL